MLIPAMKLDVSFFWPTDLATAEPQLAAAVAASRPVLIDTYLKSPYEMPSVTFLNSDTKGALLVAKLILVATLVERFLAFTLHLWSACVPWPSLPLASVEACLVTLSTGPIILCDG